MSISSLQIIQAGLEELGLHANEPDLDQMDDFKIYSGSITKIGNRCFLCSQERNFQMECPLFGELVKNQIQQKCKTRETGSQN